MKILPTLLSVLMLLFGLSTTSNAILITATFDDLGDKYLGFTPVELDTTFDSSVDFQITNNTGITWTDFHMSETTVPFNELGIYVFSGSGTGTWSSDYSSLDILDLSVDLGEVLQFSIGCDGICTYAGMQFWGHPTINGDGDDDNGNGGGDGGTPVTVPEPGALFLLGIGMLGIFSSRRRRG